MEKKWNRLRGKRIGADLFFILLGCASGAFSTIFILIPNGLSSGGITGIARILQNFVNIDYSLLYYAGAIIVFTACWILLGFGEARKILLLTILYPAFLFIFEKIDFTLLEEKDVILAAIYCGVFFGISNGLILGRGYSVGGTDTIAKIIKKRSLPYMGISKILLIIDGIIIIASGVFFGRNIALYALITQIILTRITEMVMYGFETKVVQLEIISEEHEEIARYIMEEVDRGVTKEEVAGGYTGLRRTKITTLCSPRESILIRQFVAFIDKEAFVTVIRVETVWGRGEGFSDIVEKE
ncbi:MAG: YitT family protein [Anaerovoracaceae bacterium]